MTSATDMRATVTAESNPRSISMTCVFSGGVLGIAIYDDDFEEIKGFQGWEEDKGPSAFQMLKLTLLHTMPQIIFVSQSTPRDLVEVLRDTMGISGMSAPEIRFEKHAIFQTDSALSVLKYLKVAGMPETIRDEDRMHWINARLNLAATQQVRAVGALVQILQRDGNELKVQDISTMSLDGYLAVDAVTLHGLQIFREDAHPSILGIGRSKEGFSVFGMMDRCLTPAGRRMLHSWFLRPLLNLEMINDRLNTIQVLINRPDILNLIRGPLKQIKDVSSILRRLQCHQARNKVELLEHLRTSIGAMLQLSRLVREVGNGSLYQYSEDSADWCTAWSCLSIVHKIETHVTQELRACGQLICRVIDFESKDANMYIAPNICTDLDRLKALYNQLPDMLTQVVEKELRRIPRCLSRGLAHHQWSVVYVPQVGYLVQILGSPLGAEILDTLEDYEQAFESTADDGSLICYYTAQCTEELNDRFGDILHQIKDMENSLCAELICRVLASKPVLIRSMSVCAELDCLASLAIAACDGSYCRPSVSESEDLIIKQGRHPLTEMIVDVFIPNDTLLTPTNGCIQLITGRKSMPYLPCLESLRLGPNASGKSSYMKQVALIVFLSHIGSFVPAQDCHVGLTDRLFSRICTSHTLKNSRVNQSTFMIDLTQMRTMIKQATPRSLLLIDEFGKGTLTSDGVGLLCAMLEHWASQETRPKIIVCTHFSEIFATGLAERFPDIQYRTMQVMTQCSTSEDTQKHVLLYKLINGHAAPSYGVGNAHCVSKAHCLCFQIDCAQLCGLSSDVVSRAREIISLKNTAQPVTKPSSTWTNAKENLCKELLTILARTDSTSNPSVKNLINLITEKLEL